MDVEDATAPVHDQQAPLLQGVSSRGRLAKALPPCASRMRHAPWRERCQHASLESRESVGAQGGIRVERRVEPELVAECTRELGRSVAYDHQLGAGLPDLGENVAQLRDLLSAEQSPEVTHEGQHDGPVVPQGGQGDRAPFQVQDRRLREGDVHGIGRVGHPGRV